MKLNWQINNQDIIRLTRFYLSKKDNNFVKARYKRNILRENLDLSKGFFWKSLTMCLLTTQQRSGPHNPISRFLLSDPYPLDLITCLKQDMVAEYVTTILTNFGGIRRTNKIADELRKNLEYLKQSNWEIYSLSLDLSMVKEDQSLERQIAEEIDDHLVGFGPKQSRNLLQSFGLTKYEIPLDSRITKWLNDFGFPIRLTSEGLQDKNYYNFILDGLQELCKRANIYPCLIDAAIFSSVDADGWTEKNIVF